MKKLYVVIPAYNEESTIKDVVLSWYEILKDKSEDSKVIVADDGSTDNTHSILLELMKNYPKLEILNGTGKFHGEKVTALYRYSIENSCDYIFQTDADGQTSASEFEQFWYLKDEYDAIIGSRPERGDGKSRKFVEDVLCFIINLFFSVKLKDSNAPFRLMKKELVEKYIDKIPAKYNLPNVMLCVYFSYFKENIVFKDITFKQRQAGVNSINFVKIVKIGFKALFDFYKFRKLLIEGYKKNDNFPK